MTEGKGSISQARTYREMGEFWDTHDVTEFWEQTEPVDFTVSLGSEVTYYPVEAILAAQLTAAAARHGVSPETLLNLWLQEKLHEEHPASAG